MDENGPEKSAPVGKESPARELAQLATVGIMFPVSIATGFGIGWWLDGRLGTWPWLTIFFTVCGIAAAFVNLFRTGAPRGSGTNG